MRSVTTEGFRKQFRSLPEDVQVRAKQAYRLWITDPRHASLHFRRVHPAEPIYSVRIGLHNRGVALVEGELANWFWIGSHSDYDKLLKGL